MYTCIKYLTISNCLTYIFVYLFEFVYYVYFQGWPMYAQLLIDLFKYLAPFLRNVELNKPMQILYKVPFLL